MTSAFVRILPAGLEEAEAAAEWYRRRSMRAAEMFLDELDRAIERIGDHPGQFPEYAFGTRKMVLQRFPYLLVFRETAAGVEVIAWPTDVAARVVGGIGSNDGGAVIGWEGTHHYIASVPRLLVSKTAFAEVWPD